MLHNDDYMYMYVDTDLYNLPKAFGDGLLSHDFYEFDYRNLSKNLS